MPMQIAEDREVQVPLTLVMPVKEGKTEELKRTLMALALPENAVPLEKALTKVGTVHNTRFVVLEDGDRAKLLVIALYDGSPEDYIAAFARELNVQFNLLFDFVADAPTRPVEQHVDEFTEYVIARDVKPPSARSYRAYPGLSALDIVEAFRPPNDGAPTE
jgi:hypothetical protein